MKMNLNEIYEVMKLMKSQKQTWKLDHQILFSQQQWKRRMRSVNRQLSVLLHLPSNTPNNHDNP